ncbi:hypothetical protein LSTR_LSTR000529 [Laodelphax striatellus]|uniref:BTB domain-containing protein n=1 Tax=Laodelphax striatellus TaxID=195883 RepID=A0A482WZX9_LAOST|nr:hypothetical protein LSTR_LSTR000529 [Laodelphax striatellus]
MDLNSSTDPDVSKTFKKRFLHLLDKDICDCEFIVGSQETVIKGHKLLFSAASEVFYAMFYGELKEEQSVRIVDIDPEVFQAMRQFIYTGKVNFTSAIQALSVYIAARKYIIHALSTKCVSFIQEKHIQPSEVLEFVEICKVHYIQEFEELYNKVIQEHTDKVVESDYFLLAGSEVIELILKSPSLNLSSEIDVFHHFERWVRAEAERKGVDVGEIMTGSIGHLRKHIRFLSMSLDDFITTVAGSPLLNSDEKVAVACNLKKSDSKTMPNSLSLEWQPRNFITTSLDTKCYKYKHVFLVTIDDPTTSSFGEYKPDFRGCDGRIKFGGISCIKVLEYIYFNVRVNIDQRPRYQKMYFMGYCKAKLITIELKLEVLAGKRCYPLFENNLDIIVNDCHEEQDERYSVCAKIPKSTLKNRRFSVDNASNIVNIRCSFNIDWK